MIRVAIAAALAVAYSTALYAQSPYSSVYVFGDSYSDQGRIPGIVLYQDPAWPNGQNPPLTDPPAVAPYDGGRFSNGPTWAERLPGLIGARPRPEQNYAVGGATIAPFPVGSGPDATTRSNIESVFLEVIVSPDIQLPGIQTEIDCFLGNCPANVPGFAAVGQFKPSQVVTLFGGGNDYFAFLERSLLTNGELPPPTLADVPAEVAYVTGAIKSSIVTLAAAGAKTFLVPNIPDIGVLPAYAGKPEAEVGTALSIQHAAALNAELGKLARQTHTNIYVVDFATALNTVMADPARFGFTNITDACVAPGAPPIWPASLVPGTVCANPDQHLFWDDVHPTSAAHQLLAEYAADTLMAPLTIAAQAAFAITNGDSFLRRMQDTVFGNGVTGRGSPMTPVMPPATMPTKAPVEMPAATPGWGSLFLNVQRTNGDGNPSNDAVGFKYGVTQVSGGALFRPWNNVTFGVIGGYENGTATLDQARGSIGLTSYRLGVMGRYDDGALFTGAGVAYSQDDYTLNRQTYVPQLRSAADTNGNTTSAFGAAGYRFTFGVITAGPVFALRYTSVRIDQYNEHGAPGLDMIVQTQHAEQLIGSAGIAAATQFAVGSMTIVPYINVAIEQNFAGGDQLIASALVTVPDVVRTLRIGYDGGAFGRVNGGINFLLLPGIKGVVSGETTFGRNGGNEHAFFATIAGQF